MNINYMPKDLITDWSKIEKGQLIWAEGIVFEFLNFVNSVVINVKGVTHDKGFNMHLMIDKYNFYTVIKSKDNL